MESIAWIVALPACAGLVGLVLESRRVVASALLAALALQLLVLSPALELGAQLPLAAEGTWIVLQAPPLTSWIPLLLCFLAAGAGAGEHLDAGPSAWAGLIGAALVLALASAQVLVGVGALIAANLCVLSAQQRGTLDGHDVGLGVGSHALVAGLATLAMALACLGAESLSASPLASTTLVGALLGLPAFALSRRGASGPQGAGLILAGATALATLTWASAWWSPSIGTRPALDALAGLGLAWALVSSIDALVSSNVERALRGWWLAGLGLGVASLAWGGHGETLAAVSLLLATLTLFAESASRVCGSWEADDWRGLRRLAPGAGLAAAAALAATLVPGGLWQRALTLPESSRGYVLAAATLPLLAGAWRLVASAVRGAARRPERGSRWHLALLPALFLAGLGLALRGGDALPLVRPFGVALRSLHPAAPICSLLALGLALALGRLPLSAGASARDRWLRILEPYSPQRRLVQPLLSQARKCAQREARWFEGVKLAEGVARALRATLRAPASLEAWLGTRPFEASPTSPWRSVALEAGLALAALAAALLLLRA